MDISIFISSTRGIRKALILDIKKSVLLIKPGGVSIFLSVFLFSSWDDCTHITKRGFSHFARGGGMFRNMIVRAGKAQSAAGEPQNKLKKHM